MYKSLGNNFLINKAFSVLSEPYECGVYLVSVCIICELE